MFSKNKAQARNELSNSFPKSSHAKNKPPPQHSGAICRRTPTPYKLSIIPEAEHRDHIWRGDGGGGGERTGLSQMYKPGSAHHHHRHHLSLNHEGRWGTTDDFATSFLHFSLFSTALWDLANSRPVHSLMLSSHLFVCLPCLLPPLTVPCKMVLARPDERET